MSETAISGAGANTAAALSARGVGPEAMAATILSGAASPGVGYNLGSVRAALTELAEADPGLGASVGASVEAQLSPVQRGELARAAANDTGPSTATLVADLAQMTLDIIGMIEPTPFSDGANTVFSLGRALGSALTGEGGAALGHLGNGVISGVSILPYLGDTAKVAKIGKWAQTVADAIGAVGRNPALRATFEPALRQVADAVRQLPQGAIDALPQGARESIERMKTQLDEFLGAGARQVDDAGRAIVRNADGTLDMGAAAQAYADGVASNRPWSWADNFSGAFTSGERAAIRREAISRGLVTEVPMKPGTRYADFNAAGLVRRVDTLPQDLWLRSDGQQFAWLDARIPGGRPEGFTWHHTETPGRMELVPFGEHNITNHIGGRSPGHWAHAAR